MVFDDTMGTRNLPGGNSLYNTILRRKQPLMLTRDNSGFTPTYAVTTQGPHMAFIVLGVALFAWLVIGHIRIK